MSLEFASVHNYHERYVFQAVIEAASDIPQLDNRDDLLADIACVALNRLPPRYVRHDVDFAFYLTDKERIEIERAIAEAVHFAIDFVQTRVAMRARG